jgi:signal transduction histidine kinase/CheY-like chemotaxis protein
MKVQTKITLLLLAVVAIFMAGLWAFRAFDQQKFRKITADRLVEAKRSFEAFLEKDGEPLETLADYDTNWDNMVQAIQTRNTKWLSENVSDETLVGYKAYAVWIYSSDTTLVYSRNALPVDPDLDKSEKRSNTKPADLPLPREAFAKLFAKEPKAHFFIQVGNDLMEIRGATIHGSKDHARQTPQQGFFFVGQLWNGPRLDEMSLFSNTKLSLVFTHFPPPEIVDDGLIGFGRTLPGWDGEPVAHLVVRNEMPVVRLLNRSNERLIISLFIFALVLLLLIYWSVVRWVSHPLRQIMGTLQRNDPKPIERLCLDQSEFGKMARTTRKFFEQRDNLVREMEERRATEQALRKSEEELRHSQKMEAVGRLAGGVAHDFNNLLTAIIGYAELIATKQILQPKVIDLNTLVLEMEKLLRRVIGERFDLQSHPDAENGRVKADPSQLEQVVLNLGVNARDAMPRGGKLIIRTENVRLDWETAPQIAASLVPGDYVMLSVTDTGAGMNEETKSHIFEPFFTTKGPGKGTGLGLATVYGIVRQTGGGISVESEPGKGSTFRIYLPQESAPVDFTRTPLMPVDKTDNFETVLVVEDEDIVRDLVCEVLEDQGYNVMCARDGLEALNLAEDCDGPIHLLVTDVIMPHMNGHELAGKLSELRPEMKILYVSGYSDNEIGDHGQLDPRYELLQKPFTPQTLARKIREVIREGNYAVAAK